MSDKQTPPPEEKKHAGQPTKYDDKYIQEVDNYLKHLEDLRFNGEPLKRMTLLPSVAGFARYINVDTDTINNWAKARVKDDKGNKTKKRLHSKFFGAIKRLKTWQQDQLINDGLYGGKDVNSIMAIFLLKVNHGMVETSNLDVTSKGKSISVGVVSYQESKDG